MIIKNSIENYTKLTSKTVIFDRTPTQNIKIKENLYMCLQKQLSIVLIIIFCCFSIQSSGNTRLQDSIPPFNQATFQASLEELAPREFTRLFIQQYREDSIKVAICTKYIKNEMLHSDDLRTQFWGYYSLVHWQSDLMNHETALKYIDKLYSLAKKMEDDDLILSALLNKGSFYFKFGGYKESMEYNLIALELAKETNNLKRQLAIFHNIAMIKIHTNDNIGAIELLEKALKIIESGEADKFSRLKTGIYLALVKGYIGIEDYENAKIYCEKGLELSKKNNDKESEFYCFSYLGIIKGIHGNFEGAHQSLDKSLEIALNIKTVDYEISMIYFEKGEVFYKQKKYKKAIDFLLRAEKLMEKNSINYIALEEIYALLAKSYNEVDDPISSLKYYEKANEVYKANDKRQKNISVSILRKYDLKSLKDELILAENDAKSKSVLLYVGTCSIFVLVISFGVFYKKREKQNKKKFQELLSESNGLIKYTQNTTILKIDSESGKNDISEVVAFEILKKLENFENKVNYLNNNITLSNVAAKLDTNPKYLSKTINKYKNKSFVNYIKDLRMDYAIDRLKSDKKFRSYKIEAIAKEIGYNRPSTFSKAFKSKTGIYPSYFIKQLCNQLVD